MKAYRTKNNGQIISSAISKLHGPYFRARMPLVIKYEDTTTNIQMRWPVSLGRAMLIRDNDARILEGVDGGGSCQEGVDATLGGYDRPASRLESRVTFFGWGI